MKTKHETSTIMAERLKALRESRGLSHEKLSIAISQQYGDNTEPSEDKRLISRDSLINYEKASGKNLGMRAEHLMRLANFYGVSTDYLIGLTDKKTPDTTAQGVIDYTGLSEENVKTLHEMVENAKPVLDFFATENVTYRDGCKPILDCFNDLFGALMEDDVTSKKAVTYYVRIRQKSGHWGEYKDDEYYIGTQADVFPGIHKEKENNVIVEHSCVKIARIIERKLKEKYMGYYLEKREDE